MSTERAKPQMQTAKTFVPEAHVMSRAPQSYKIRASASATVYERAETQSRKSVASFRRVTQTRPRFFFFASFLNGELLQSCSTTRSLHSKRYDSIPGKARFRFSFRRLHIYLTHYHMTIYPVQLASWRTKKKNRQPE